MIVGITLFAAITATITSNIIRSQESGATEPWTFPRAFSRSPRGQECGSTMPRNLRALADLYNAFIARHAMAWELTFAALAILYVAVGFVAENAGPTTRQAIELAEAALTAIFVFEFASRFLAARNRSRYFVGHLIDLIALVPTARGLRVFRLLRLLRMVRAFSGMFRVLGEIERIAAHRALLALVTAWLGVMVMCSIAFYVMESETNPGIQSPLDALWWGIATLTGGDPLVTITTLEGRIAAGVLLLVGVALFGAIIAVLTSQLMTRLQAQSQVPAHSADIPDQIRKLAELHGEGLLTTAEFEAKKAELLARL